MSIFLKCAFALTFTIAATASAEAAPPWVASGTQTCNETFSGSDLDSNFIPVPGPTAAPYIGENTMDGNTSTNYIMLHPGFAIVPKHQNFQATSSYTFPYTTSIIVSRPGTVGCGYQQYGWFEVQMAMPPASTAGHALGSWPAWWMMPSNGGTNWEFDFMERFDGAWGQGTDPTHFWTTLHYNSYANSAGICQYAGPDARSWVDKHTLAVDWEPSSIAVYMDGTICTGPSNPTGTYVTGGLFVAGTGPGGIFQNLGQGTVTVGSGGTAGTYALAASGGTGCAGTFAGTYTISGGSLTSINVTNTDSGCTSAPTLSFPSGGISGAAATLLIMGGIPQTPGFHIFDNLVYNNLNQAQETAIDQGNANFNVYSLKAWQKNSNTQTILPLHIGQVTTDKTTYNPGDTMTITVPVYSGNSALTGVGGSMNVYDFCGDNTSGYSPCQYPATNSGFGSAAVFSPGISIAANSSATITTTWAVPSTIPPGVYTGELSIHDTGSVDTDGSLIHINVGSPNP